MIAQSAFLTQKCSAPKAKNCAFFHKNCAEVLRMETLDDKWGKKL